MLLSLLSVLFRDYVAYLNGFLIGCIHYVLTRLVFLQFMSLLYMNSNILLQISQKRFNVKRN
jgi:hypothetical protein